MSPIRLSKIESPTRSILAYREAYNNRDVDAILALLSEDCRFEPAKNNLALNGKEAIGEYFSDLFSELHNEKLVGIDLFQTGFQVVFRWELDGRGGVDIFKFRDKKIAEIASYQKE